MNMTSNDLTSRREFLRTSSVAVVAGAITAPFVLTSQAASPGDQLKIGLVGCGGRGSGAALEALHADSNIAITSMGDAFKEPLDACLKNLQNKKDIADKVKVQPDQCFVGLDAYQKVIDSGVDVVLLASPPGFRPQHLKAAVAAGKHIFCEKPMATDGPGVRSVLDSVKAAKEKNLALVAGFCWRYDLGRREFYQRIHDGAIGDLRAIYATYYTGPVKPMPAASQRPAGMSDLEWQLRHWYNFTWLGGDGYVEQCVHSVDKVAWAMHDEPPLKAVATGGRATPNNEGNIFDHMFVVYEYPKDVRAFVGQRQIANCFSENYDYLMGGNGFAKIPGWSAPFIKASGKDLWRYTGAANNMYQTEHDELFKSIRDGKPINDGTRMAHSTLLAIMGRMAAYTGQEISWERALNSEEKLVQDNLTWDMKLPISPLPLPGTTKIS